MANFVKITKIRQFLSQEACATLILGLSMSHLDYANALLCNAPKVTIHPSQKIQNMWSKLMLKRYKYETSGGALRDLHWHPIQARIEFKILSLMHQCTHGCGPKYLKEILMRESTVRSLRNSAEDQYNYVIQLCELEQSANWYENCAGVLKMQNFPFQEILWGFVIM